MDIVRIFLNTDGGKNGFDNFVEILLCTSGARKGRYDNIQLMAFRLR